MVRFFKVNKLSNIKNKEVDIMRSIMDILNMKNGTRIFRNNVGISAAYDFKLKRLSFPLRFIRYGLCPGSSDLIGWKSVEVTQEMVGKKLAIFTAVEVKKSEKEKATEKQLQFLEEVKKAGGISRRLNSMDDALAFQQMN